MEHPNEAMIQAFLDGERAGDGGEVRNHLQTCPRCTARAQGRAGTAEAVRRSLALLDVDPPVVAARATVLRHSGRPRRWIDTLRRNLPRAAAFVVLLTAGTAAAFPGSPVREWIVKEWADRVGQARPDSSTVGKEGTSGPAETSASGGETVGATILAGREGIELRVSGMVLDASLRVRLVDGDEAGIFAGEGTRFRTETGRLLASDPPGDVTMEIPLESASVTLVVNGEVYLKMAGGSLELLGPVRTRTPTEIRFGPPEGEANPPSSGG